MTYILFVIYKDLSSFSLTQMKQDALLKKPLRHIQIKENYQHFQGIYILRKTSLIILNIYTYFFLLTKFSVKLFGKKWWFHILFQKMLSNMQIVSRLDLYLI